MKMANMRVEKLNIILIENKDENKNLDEKGQHTCIKVVTTVWPS